MQWLRRFVGVAILGIATAGTIGLWFAARLQPNRDPAINRRSVLGSIAITYDPVPPSIQILATAGVLAVIFAVGVVALERRIINSSRRAENRRRAPLAPKVVMAETRGRFDGPVTITALVPAHNEADRIQSTLAALLAQEPPPNRVIVVADNCTDATVDRARAAGAEVIESVGNRDKKAGALNQALAQVLPALGSNDVVLVMDADTALDRGFLGRAVELFTADRALMAVGALFYGEDGAGLIGQFQRNEYMRYSREIQRRLGHPYVLTGTASMFRPLALRTIAAERGRMLPGRPGNFYDTNALTEDNELTLAVKSLGGLLTSPTPCSVVTEVMPDWHSLWTQRLRWQRGALENLAAYGVTRPTFRYWAQQVGIGYGVFAFGAYLLLMFLMLLNINNLVWYPFWVGVGLLFVAERVATVWRGGWRARLLAVLLVPELAYALFLNAVYLKGIADIASGRRAQWGGLETPTTTAEVA